MTREIVVVDDMPELLDLYERLLSRVDGVRTHRFESPLLALLWALENETDLLIVDYEMPEMNGVEFVARFRKRHASGRVPVIMVTSHDDKNLRYLALDLGVDEYLHKPIDSIEFLKRVRNLLRWREQSRHPTCERDENIIELLTRLSELRVKATANRAARIGNYARLLARALGLGREQQELLLLAVPVYDLGKVGIPDEILLKAGRLTPEEFDAVKKHARLGYELLKQSESPLVRLAAEIALSHHERYDGTGYPQGLAGDAIPLSGRMCAIIDVFDALLSARPFRPAYSLSASIEALEEGRGAQFDPALVDAYLDLMSQLQEIRQQFSD